MASTYLSMRKRVDEVRQTHTCGGNTIRCLKFRGMSLNQLDLQHSHQSCWQGRDPWVQDGEETGAERKLGLLIP